MPDRVARWEKVPGEFWRCYGDLGKGVGSGDDSQSYSRLADSRGSYDEDHPWFQPQHTSGSDYSGTLVERSNFDVLLALAEDLATEHGSDWFQVLHGGYRTFAILFHAIRTPDEIVDMLSGLGDYPLIDEQRHSEMELEAEDEAWKDWGRREYKQGLEKLYKGTAEHVSDDELDRHFEEWRESSNTYWVNEQGDTMYIDLSRIFKEIERQDGDPPAGFLFGDFSREELAEAANKASRESRRSGAPALSAGSSRDVLIAWLAWNDPNGVYRDADLRREGYEPMTLDDAWTALSETLQDEMTSRA